IPSRPCLGAWPLGAPRCALGMGRRLLGPRTPGPRLHPGPLDPARWSLLLDRAAVATNAQRRARARSSRARPGLAPPLSAASRIAPPAPSGQDRRPLQPPCALGVILVVSSTRGAPRERRPACNPRHGRA